MSVPNQRIITINKPKYKDNFLMISITEWQDLIKNLRYVNGDTILKEPKDKGLKPSSIALYLYLASNADGFRLELSPQAFKNATGFSYSSYDRAYHELSALGYINEDNKGCLTFAPSPKFGNVAQNQIGESNESKMKRSNSNYETPSSQIWSKSDSTLNREINNKYEIKNTDKIKKAKDFSYLKDIVDPADGSYEYKGKHGWIDAGNRMFYEETEEQQLSEMIVNTPFNKEESLYILRNIMTQNDTEKTYESFKEYNNENELDEFDDWYYSDEQVMARKYRNWMKQECARIEKENITNFEEYE